jgi:ubiquinone/menaquinone biosynthesis C-methylase UbiE
VEAPDMLGTFFLLAFKTFPGLKGVLWKQGYQFLSKFNKEKAWKFMNYGYCPGAENSCDLRMDEIDEIDQYCIRLYHHVASPVSLKNMNVLEVGSGRGGGAVFIKRHLMPSTVVGLDNSANAVAFCQRIYDIKGLSFRVGDAESLPFADSSFDIVVNIESSHCYNSTEAFFKQVKRVLQDGGYLLFADFRAKSEVETLREEIDKSGLHLIRETDITANVVEALRRDSARKKAEITRKIAQTLKLDQTRRPSRIKKTIHQQLVHLILEFSGTIGSRIYTGFQSGNAVYLSFILQKVTA